MKVILLVDVPKLGKKDEIIDTNDGYAKNYLIKNKLAVGLSPGTLRSLKERNQKRDQENLELTNNALALKKIIENKIFQFSLKCHDNKVFGHISLKELLNEINKEFPQINKYMFIEKKHEWSIGKHDIEIQLYENVNALIHIEVLKENC